MRTILLAMAVAALGCSGAVVGGDEEAAGGSAPDAGFVADEDAGAHDAAPDVSTPECDPLVPHSDASPGGC